MTRRSSCDHGCVGDENSSGLDVETCLNPNSSDFRNNQHQDAATRSESPIRNNHSDGEYPPRDLERNDDHPQLVSINYSRKQEHVRRSGCSGLVTSNDITGSQHLKNNNHDGLSSGNTNSQLEMPVANGRTCLERKIRSTNESHAHRKGSRNKKRNRIRGGRNQHSFQQSGFPNYSNSTFSFGSSPNSNYPLNYAAAAASGQNNPNRGSGYEDFNHTYQPLNSNPCKYLHNNKMTSEPAHPCPVPSCSSCLPQSLQLGSNKPATMYYPEMSNGPNVPEDYSLSEQEFLQLLLHQQNFLRDYHEYFGGQQAFLSRPASPSTSQSLPSRQQHTSFSNQPSNASYQIPPIIHGKYVNFLNPTSDYTADQRTPKMPYLSHQTGMGQADFESFKAMNQRTSNSRLTLPSKAISNIPGFCEPGAQMNIHESVYNMSQINSDTTGSQLPNHIPHVQTKSGFSASRGKSQGNNRSEFDYTSVNLAADKIDIKTSSCIKNSSHYVSSERPLQNYFEAPAKTFAGPALFKPTEDSNRVHRNFYREKSSDRRYFDSTSEIVPVSVLEQISTEGESIQNSRVRKESFSKPNESPSVYPPFCGDNGLHSRNMNDLKVNYRTSCSNSKEWIEKSSTHYDASRRTASGSFDPSVEQFFSSMENA